MFGGVLLGFEPKSIQSAPGPNNVFFAKNRLFGAQETLHLDSMVGSGALGVDFGSKPSKTPPNMFYLDQK